MDCFQDGRTITSAVATWDFLNVSSFLPALEWQKNFLHGFRVTDDEGTLVQWGHYDGI